MDSLTSMGESAVLEMDATHVLQTNQPEASVNDTNTSMKEHGELHSMSYLRLYNKMQRLSEIHQLSISARGKAS